MVTRADHGDMMAAVLAALSSLRVADSTPPADAGWQGVPGQSTFLAYLTVWSMDDASIEATGTDLEVDHEHLITVRAYGATPEQARRYAETARTALTAASLSITGRVVLSVRTDLVGSVLDVDDERPALYQAPVRYRIYTTSA